MEKNSATLRKINFKNGCENIRNTRKREKGSLEGVKKKRKKRRGNKSDLEDNVGDCKLLSALTSRSGIVHIFQSEQIYRVRGDGGKRKAKYKVCM